MGGWSYSGQRRPPGGCPVFPALNGPPVSAEADVPETTQPMCSMDTEDSNVSSGSPSVPEVEVTPGTSGVSLLTAVDSMDGMDSDNESVDNVSVVNSESKTESM